MPEDGAQIGSRRDFLHYATFSFGALMVGSSAWGLGATMAPSADVLHTDLQVVDIKKIASRKTRSVKVDGQIIHIRRLTPQQVEEVFEMDPSAGGG